METRVRTTHDVFFQPQRLLVPLFQRPYVWSREAQWSPLWDDVRRLADQQWTIIDGQQRLATLQLLLDAAHQTVDQAGVGLPTR